MNISNIVLHRLSVPLPRAVRTSIHNHTHADTVVVEMRAGDHVGVGYCFAFGPHRARALAALAEDLAPFYQGKPVSAVSANFEAAWRAINFMGHTGAVMMALSALDTACWDLAARAVGLPLFRYLGGAHARVPTYASEGLWVDYSVDELLKEAAAFRAKGHRAMKMRIGAREPADDLERVRLLREAIGPDVKLLADVNQGWDEPTAIRMGRRLQAHDLYWIEEPLPYEDLEGCARVAAALDVRVASGETEYGSLAMKRHLDLRVADVLMPDLQRMGGITEYRRAAELCRAYHQPVSSHVFMEASAHVLAAAPNALILEHMDWWQHIFTEPLRLEEGCVVLSENPGIGLDLDRKALDRFKA